MANKIIEECYRKSVELLLRNSTKSGFLAATPRGRAARSIWQYDRVFGRDGSICALGAVASGDIKLTRIARRTLLTLGRHQTERGQIPNAVGPKKKDDDFWFMTSADGTLWWLVALDFYSRHSGDRELAGRLKAQAAAAIAWLRYQTGGATNLLSQAAAGDWADIMPRSGHVLYANVLWYLVQKLYQQPGVKMTRAGLNTLFYPAGRQNEDLFYARNRLYRSLRHDLRRRLKPVPFYLSHVGVYSAGRHADVYANLLAVLAGLPGREFARRLLCYFLAAKVNRPYPVRVLVPPVRQDDREWHEVMEHRGQNLPDCYHNGGIWPFVGGFWVMALHKLGEKKLAQAELENLARANRANNWQFNEWFHGRTGKPSGMAGQSWNAGTFLLAYHYLKGEIKL